MFLLRPLQMKRSLPPPAPAPAEPVLPTREPKGAAATRRREVEQQQRRRRVCVQLVLSDEAVARASHVALLLAARGGREPEGLDGLRQRRLHRVNHVDDELVVAAGGAVLLVAQRLR